MKIPVCLHFANRPFSNVTLDLLTRIKHGDLYFQIDTYGGSSDLCSREFEAKRFFWKVNAVNLQP